MPRRIFADSFGGLENASMARDAAFDNRYARSLSALMQAQQMAQSEASREQQAIENAQRNALTRAQLQAQSAQAADQMSFTRQNRLDTLAQQAREANDRKAYYDAMTRTTGPEAQIAKQKAAMAEQVGEQTTAEEQDYSRIKSLIDAMNKNYQADQGANILPSRAGWDRGVEKHNGWFNSRGDASKKFAESLMLPGVDVASLKPDAKGDYYDPILTRLKEIAAERKAPNQPIIDALTKSRYMDDVTFNPATEQYESSAKFRYFKPPQAQPQMLAQPRIQGPDRPGQFVGQIARDRDTGLAFKWNGQQWTQ